MILLGKQHNDGTIPGNVKSFDVPIITMAPADANPARRKVWANNYAWLVPVMKTSYNRSICLLDNEGNEDLDGEGNQIMNNVIFFDNTGITAGVRLSLSQEESVQVGVTRDTTIVNTYYPMHKLDESFRSDFMDYIEYTYALPAELDDNYGSSYGEYKIFYIAASGRKKAYYQLFQWSQGYYNEEEGKWETTDDCWTNIGDMKTTERDGYDLAEKKWIASSEEIITTTPIVATYTQYFLGANGITPVFKKCNSSGTNGVNYGGAYVRVWSTLLGGAAAREDMSFELFDEDGTEITYQNDEVTGIRSLQNTIDAKKENRQVYNLQGQKLDKMKPGLNIVNGKKYFVK
jgi:hypothetical protein